MLPKDSGFNQSGLLFMRAQIVTFPTVDVCLPLSIGRGKALAVPAKVARWQHC